MELHDLRPDEGARRNRTRVGRGYAAGKGKTAGRGTKGQGARSGGGKPAYFEGGQLPLVRRLPFKRGFTNIFRIEYQIVNVDELDAYFDSGADITPEVLAEVGLVREGDQPVKVLGRGELTKSLNVYAHKFSRSAQEQIEASGGRVEMLELELTGAHATVKKLRKERLEALRAKDSQSEG